MGRRRLAGVLTGAVALVLSPALAGAAPLTAADYDKPVGYYRFCADAQLTVADIDEDAMEAADISIGGTIYEDKADFTLSKSAVELSPSKRILVRQFVESAPGDPDLREMYWCKLRTGESIDAGAWPVGADNNGGRFAVDPYYGFGEDGEGIASETPVACSAVNQRTLDAVWGALTTEQKTAAVFSPEGPSPTLVNGEDAIAYLGPQWLAATAPAFRTGDVLTLESRKLLSLSGSTGSPAGARVEAAHYCTLIAPEYLRALVLGDAELPDTAAP